MLGCTAGACCAFYGTAKRAFPAAVAFCIAASSPHSHQHLVLSASKKLFQPFS